MNNLSLGLQNLIPYIGDWIILVVLWVIFWKGLALWHSAIRKQAWWFVALLIINTIGILEIIYLFGVAKIKFRNLFSKQIEQA